MYEIKKTRRLKDELKLVDGGKELIVPVDIDITSAMDRYNRARNDIIRAKSSTPEEMGKAVITMFTVFFGDDATVQIAEWYEGRWAEMLEDVFPYIDGVLVPKLKAASEAKRDKLVAVYKASAAHGNRAVRHAAKKLW